MRAYLTLVCGFLTRSLARDVRASLTLRKSHRLVSPVALIHQDIDIGGIEMKALILAVSLFFCFATASSAQSRPRPANS